MELLLSGLIVLIATVIGSTTGIGGGVVIKPLFDALTHFPLEEVGLYSSCAVFVMSFVALMKAYKHGYRPKYRLVLLLGVSALIGGTIGEQLLTNLLSIAGETLVGKGQSLALCITFIVIIIYFLKLKNTHTFRIRSTFLILLTGLCLGTYSMMLGIGGGPINVMFLVLLFTMDAKEASVYSLIIIFFAQIPKIANLIIYSNQKTWSMDVMIIVAICAMFGGYIGANMNKKLKSDHIQLIYVSVLICLSLLSFWNFISR